MSPPKPVPPPKPAPLPSYPAPSAPPSLPPPKPISQAASEPGQRPLPASVPPPPKAPKPATFPARANPATAPAFSAPGSVPPGGSYPSVGNCAPVANVSPSSIPAPIVPVPIPLVGTPSSRSPASPSAEEFYVKAGDDVRTLKRQEVKEEIESGRLGPAALVCRVGDTEWRTVFDAAEFGLKPLRDEPSVTSVADTELVFEEPRRPAKRKRVGFVGRAWQSIVKRNGRLTLAAWFVTGVLGLVAVLHQNGALHRAAGFIGMSSTYENLEKDLLGGPGVGTVRGAERAFQQSVGDGKIPFSNVQARVSEGRPADETK